MLVFKTRAIDHSATLPNFGTGNRDRTCDLTIIGRLLYQLSYTRTYLTVYRVTGKLTTRAGFISDSLARGLLPLPHSLGLVSDYNPSTHLLCSRISQVSCLTLHLPVGFPCPSVNREAKTITTMRKNKLAPEEGVEPSLVVLETTVLP